MSKPFVAAPPRVKQQDVLGAQSEAVRRSGGVSGPERDVAGVRGARSRG